MQPLTYLSIDLQALRHNFDETKRCANHSRLLAMLKADAYGHGLIQCAHALTQADGFGVARIDEAIALRNSGITQKIVLLNAEMNEDTFQYCAHHNIDMVIYDEHGIATLRQSHLSAPLTVWLKIDTRMHRLGLPPDRLFEFYQSLQAHPQVTCSTIMTHFSDAEASEPHITQQQFMLFQHACKHINADHSLANSAAIIQSSETHADWVRPGIMLYGSHPLASPSPEQRIPLRSVMSLHSRVLSIRDIACDEPVGYNGTWIAQRQTRIATVGIGYGDGYPRHAKSGTPILIKGQRCQLIGRVSMDLITVDITETTDVQIGDEVTLWGYDSCGNELLANEVANHANTISYDLFTGVTQRVARMYSN